MLLRPRGLWPAREHGRAAQVPEDVALQPPAAAQIPPETGHIVPTIR
jgi:hypothetical protein